MNGKFLFSLCIASSLAVPCLAGAVTTSENDLQLSLRQAVETALTNNLNLKLQREETNIAEGAVEIANSRFDKTAAAGIGAQSQEFTPLMPGGAEQEEKASFEASVAKQFTTGTKMEVSFENNRYDSDAEGFLINPSYTNSLKLNLSQPLLRGWGSDIQTTEVKAAEKNVEASTFQVDSLAADLAAEVKNGYWELVFAWQDIEVKRLSVTLAQKLLEETEAKIDAGKLAQVELYQPQSEVARREEELIGAERAIGAAEDNLKLLMNSNDWLTAYNPVDKPSTTPVDPEPELVLANALSNRPDLKAADLGIEAAKLNEILAKDNLRPSLDLVGGVGYGGTDEEYGDAISAVVDDSDVFWQVGLNLTYPLDNSLAEGSLRQAKAEYNKAKTSAQLLRLEIKRSVRTTVRDVQLAIKAMEATRKTSLATFKRLEAEQAKFEAGRSTTLDVLIAQEAYSQALSQENRTNIVYAQSLAELDRIQGQVTFGSAQ